MKTLLLALVVVAFVYLEPGYTIICRSCTGPICRTFKNCSDAQACYQMWTDADVLKLKLVRGCADTCSFPGPGEKRLYCSTDNCN
uniref:3FTx-Dis1 n=1 Tax=Dispholidus typus TaxID=46295 RepID=A7X3Q4_DISTY|nr:3FTx-Dis1 [Dispholidus typus]